MSKVHDEWRVALNLCSQWFTAGVLILMISLSNPQFSALSGCSSLWIAHSRTIPWAHSVFCSVFGTRDFHFLQPGYPPFEVDQIDVCPTALQPRDCRPLQRRLAAGLPDGFTTIELSSGSTSSSWDASSSSFSSVQLVSYCCDACSYCCDAAISSSSSSFDTRQSVGWPRCWTSPAYCSEPRSTDSPRSSIHRSGMTS